MLGTNICTSRTNPIHPQPDGTVTMDYEGGVASLQPDGSFASRPVGTAGAWECAKRVTVGGVPGLLFHSFEQAAAFVAYLDV
jgi:hypothetical protein